MTDSLRKTETSSVPPVRARASDVFSIPPSASPFDQNSKLWESIMPPPKPPLYAVVKRRVGALSDGLFELPVAGTITSLAERLPAKIPGWQRLGYAARWSIMTGAGMALAFTLTWSLTGGSAPSAKDDAAAPLANTAAVSQPIQRAHALKPAALPAVPVAVSTPEPDTTRIPTSSIANPDDAAAAPAELEPSEKPAAKTKQAKAKKKLAKSKARKSKKARSTRSASR